MSNEKILSEIQSIKREIFDRIESKLPLGSWTRQLLYGVRCELGRVGEQVEVAIKQDRAAARAEIQDTEEAKVKS